MSLLQCYVFSCCWNTFPHLLPQTFATEPSKSLDICSRTYHPSKLADCSWPPACTGRVVRSFSSVFNYELLDVLGGKWVCCLGGQGATRVFFSPLPRCPYNTDQLRKLGLSSSSYKAPHGSQSCAPARSLPVHCRLLTLPLLFLWGCICAQAACL